jgi:hypothetical protein
VIRELYTKKKQRIPSIHILLLLAGDSEISTAQKKTLKSLPVLSKENYGS